MNSKAMVLAASALAATGLGLAAQTKPAASAAAKMVVYKSPTCGCCVAWIQHLRAAGFQVEAHDVTDAKLSTVKAESGVTDELSSCHTAKIDGYTIEGHVPAADVQKMLKERPKVSGIAVPGMPTGSPGMEGGAKQPYDTVAFTKGGAKTVYVPHR